MERVICDKEAFCDHREMCGAVKLHPKSSCEPCPFYPDAKCIAVELEPYIKFTEDGRSVLMCNHRKGKVWSQLVYVGDRGLEAMRFAINAGGTCPDFSGEDWACTSTILG